MADSLRLKGARSVTKHTGGEMKLRRPARGGDVFKVPTWWNLKHTVQYTSAAIFNVISTRGGLALVVPIDPETTDILIKHDGAGEFTFPKALGVDRVAVMSADLGTFYVEYQFSKISGGPVLKRTVNALPSEQLAVAFGAATAITGSAIVGETLTATAATYTGGIGSVTTNLIFQKSDTGSGGWSFLAGNPGVTGGNTATYTLQAADSGKYIRASYQVVDDEATHSSNSTGTGPIADTFATRVANADLSYTVTVVNTAAEGDPAVNVYALNGTNQQAVSLSVGESVAFDFSGVSGAHPLGLFTSADKTTPVTVGVEESGGTLLFTPVINATLSYQCINHAAMGGTITVS